MKNLIERDIYTTDKKDRTECFDEDLFPSRMKHCTREHRFGIGLK
jgi:hypothetical protein